MQCAAFCCTYARLKQDDDGLGSTQCSSPRGESACQQEAQPAMLWQEINYRQSHRLAHMWQPASADSVLMPAMMCCAPWTCRCAPASSSLLLTWLHSRTLGHQAMLPGGQHLQSQKLVVAHYRQCLLACVLGMHQILHVDCMQHIVHCRTIDFTNTCLSVSDNTQMPSLQSMVLLCLPHLPCPGR
jgi:hypothetical protein